MTEYKKRDKVFSIALIITTVFFILSLSIYLPLNNRKFYYDNIDKLNIVETTNDWLNTDYTKQDIIDAYDDVLDFIWKGKEFKTGKLAFSEDGKSHFEDCVGLFWLDFIILIVSSILMVTALILILTKVFKVYDFLGFSPLFFGSIITLLLVSLLGIFALIDFDKLFELFHKVFFPGKTNWVFDPDVDQVILILPEDYFMYCAYMIFSGLGVLSISSIIYSVIKRRKKFKQIK